MNPTATLALACTLLCLVACGQEEGKFKDPRDKKTYKTVKIGEQVWMAENNNYEVEGSKCYKDSTAYCDKYGRLYDWYMAMEACPKGWHLPDTTEWNVLRATVGGYRTAGKFLKAVSGWEDYKGKPGNGKDAYSFSALPGGVGDFSGNRFYGVGEYGRWWSSAIEYDSDNASCQKMNNSNEYADYFIENKDYLYSVRCLQDSNKQKDEPINEPKDEWQIGTFTDTRDGKTYKTVKIDEQVWFAENLNYETKGGKCYGEGAPVVLCWNDYKPTEATLSNAEIQANCGKYGRLYNWKTAMKACPGGWHLPTNEEWEVLFDAAGGDITAGKYLKATSGWNDYKGMSGNGRDTYGFSALPGGSGDDAYNGNFDKIGKSGGWWSASVYEDEDSNDVSYMVWYMDSREGTGFGFRDDDDLLSVRCLQNTPAPPTGEAK